VVIWLLLDHGRWLRQISQQRHVAQLEPAHLKEIIEEIRTGNHDLSGKIEAERQQYGVLEQKAVSHLLHLTVAINELKAKLARFFGASETPPPSEPSAPESKRPYSRDKEG